MKRILAFDVGDRRIGVAVSDALGITAQGVETYTRTGDDEKDFAHFIELAKKYEPVKLLFGLPKNMDGTEGHQAQSVRDFAQKLIDVTGYEYDFYDERLTTVSAHQALLDGNISRKKHKGVVDKIAAVLILQGYMESHGGIL